MREWEICNYIPKVYNFEKGITNQIRIYQKLDLYSSSSLYFNVEPKAAFNALGQLTLPLFLILIFQWAFMYYILLIRGA